MTDKKAIAEQLGVFATYLRDRGLKMTRQREVVVTAFLKEEGHLSADELFTVVRKVDSKIGLATVFRTLKTLTDCGLAREIDLGDGRARFEHDYKQPHHHHLICEECQTAIEFTSPEFERLQEKIVSQYEFKPTRHKLQIFGLCKRCQEQRRQKPKVYDSDKVFARDALRIAMATEERGINFYSTAAEMVEDKATRGAFLEMLDEEKSHLRDLEREWDKMVGDDKEILQAPVFLHFDYDALDDIFPSRKNAKKALDREMTSEEALKIAMDMELEAHNFFKQYAERFNDTRGRDIFIKFADEEQEHYDIIKKEYDRLREAVS
ncbi:MAG TPA: transcriptional repressor [Acidobacteriota bacterium]|nr:transcriptional repressor [Acidobacteriota bacterium]